MDIIEIITLYNPKVSLDKESVFMIPADYVNEIRELAKMYNAKIQIFQKRKSKYAYIKWSPGEKVGGK